MNFVTGDICDAPEPMILQGCNAQGVMGSGVAKAIRIKWPVVYDIYRTHYLQRGLIPGQVVFVRLADTLDPLYNVKRIIACLITQDQYGYDGKKYAQYSFLIDGLREVRDQCKRLNISKVATPPIGCGLGGLKKEFVFELLEEQLTEHGISVTVYDNRKNEWNKSG